VDGRQRRTMRRGFIIRSAEDECGIPENTGEHWNEADAGEVEVAYAVAAPADRARILRRYISSATYHTAIIEHADFAKCLAMGAGFSERELRDMRHLKDGAEPEFGWKGDAFRFSVPRAASHG
jgi:hypothetical protein